VKAHRGEPANEEADIQADKAISGKDVPRPQNGTTGQIEQFSHGKSLAGSPTFASPWRNSFVQIHGRKTLLKTKFGTTPQKRPKNDLNWGLGSSYSTNNPTHPNPSFSYEFTFVP